jgi:hypothetical protein
MKKDGTIILLDTDDDHSRQVCDHIKAAGFKNEFVCFTTSGEAATYIKENTTDIFILMQSTLTDAIEIEDSRNMIYMHEKFDTERIPYMFLILANQNLPVNTAHTFVHCYYKPDTPVNLAASLSNVIEFWKDHMFPPKVNHNT